MAAQKSPWIVPLVELLVCGIPAAVSMQTQVHSSARAHGLQEEFTKIKIRGDLIAKYLTDEELLSINQEESVPGKCTLERSECCLGATSAGGNSVWRSGKCSVAHGVRYDERFQWNTPDGPKEMYDLVDALDRAPASITWMGDSVLNQVWNAASCALHRKPRNYILNLTDFKDERTPQIDTLYGGGIGAQYSSVLDASEAQRLAVDLATDLQRVSAMSAQHGEGTVKMEFWRAYRPITMTNLTFKAIGSSALGKACATSEVLISNFGAHWNHDNEQGYEGQMGRLLDYLSYCIKSGGRLKTFIYIEPLPQHFVGPDGTYRSVMHALDQHTYTTEEIERFAVGRNMSVQELQDADRNFSLGRCYPQRHIGKQPRSSSWRSRVFQKAVHDRGMQIGGAVAQSMVPALQVFVLPTHDFMSHSHYMHPDECTHWCYTPLLYEPLWHRLHEIFSAMKLSSRGSQ